MLVTASLTIPTTESETLVTSPPCHHARGRMGEATILLGRPGAWTLGCNNDPRLARTAACRVCRALIRKPCLKWSAVGLPDSDLSHSSLSAWLPTTGDRRPAAGGRDGIHTRGRSCSRYGTSQFLPQAYIGQQWDFGLNHGRLGHRLSMRNCFLDF